jgi:hypothetical protein
LFSRLRSFTEGFEERALTHEGQEKARFSPHMEAFLRDLMRVGGARFLCGCRAACARFLYEWRTAPEVDLVVLERNFVEIQFVGV